MTEFVKCTNCHIRYVTNKAKENFQREGLKGEALWCLHCIEAITGKVINRFGYLVPLEELEHEPLKRVESIPRTLIECRPCMKKKHGKQH